MDSVCIVVAVGFFGLAFWLVGAIGRLGGGA
jgi:hypothetical protein